MAFNTHRGCLKCFPGTARNLVPWFLGFQCLTFMVEFRFFLPYAIYSLGNTRLGWGTGGFMDPPSDKTFIPVSGGLTMCTVVGDPYYDIFQSH